MRGISPFIRIGATGFVLALAFGCASMFSSSPVSIKSEPPLPREVIRNLGGLTSVPDVLENKSTGSELLRLTASADEQTMNSFLRSLGFYDASVTHEIIGEKEKPHVVFHIVCGPAYRMETYDIFYPPDYQGPRPAPTNKLKNASAVAITGVRSSVIRRLKENGYPEAIITNEAVLVDHATRQVYPMLHVDPGVPARFDGIQVDGLQKLSPSYVDKARPWKKGDSYDIRQVELLEKRLAASGLFSSLQSSRDQSAGTPDDEYNLRLNLRERKARTLQLGVGYKTDTGAETAAQWQHRNSLGHGENIILRGKVTEQGYEAEVRMLVPFFFRSDQQWGNSLIYSKETPEAYESRSLKAETWLSRDINRHFTIRSGISLRYLEETQDGETELYYLLSLPNSVLIDYSNDRLDATRGFRIFGQTEPFQSLEQADLQFWKNLVTIEGFQPFNSRRTWLAAIRVTGGSISGSSLNGVPADVRFYAGGGQSVRGYEYQSISPRNGEDIIGGQSLVESSLEIRGRLNKSVGVVAFIDGGTAYEEQIPDFSEAYRWGTGLGFRYFTPVGPLRLDAGVPLNRRDGIDASWQFYISIGQAF